MFTCSCRPGRHKAERLDPTPSERHALYSEGRCGCGETFTLVEWGEHTAVELGRSSRVTSVQHWPESDEALADEIKHEMIRDSTA